MKGAETASPIAWCCRTSSPDSFSAPNPVSECAHIRRGFWLLIFISSPNLFAQHISYLAEHHYTPLTVTEFVKSVTKKVKMSEQQAWCLSARLKRSIPKGEL